MKTRNLFAALLACAPACASMREYGHGLCENAAAAKGLVTATANAVNAGIDAFCDTVFVLPSHIPADLAGAISTSASQPCPGCAAHGHP